MQAASAQNPDGGFKYRVTDFTSAAAGIRQAVGGDYRNYDAPGLSQLFSIARGIAASGVALSALPDSAPLDQSMAARVPWDRPTGEQEAMPIWQARAEVAYTDEAGTPLTGIFTVTIPQVLPSTVGSLRAQMALRIQDMLASPPGTGTPRSGSLAGVGAITLMQV
jgi:hypothetical protein